MQLGRKNASALMIVFGFLYINSIPLVNLLERTELFGVSQEILEQLSLALSDLVTLVANVATHFHEAIRQSSTQSVSINMYSTFSAKIKSFHERCEDIALSMWRHKVLADDMDPDAGIYQVIIYTKHIHAASHMPFEFHLDISLTMVWRSLRYQAHKVLARP